MKPFLMLSHRPEDVEAEREHVGVVRSARLEPRDVEQRRLDQAHLGEVDFEQYSGVIVAGGPFSISDEEKSDQQRRVERELLGVTERCIEADFPFLGLCYGMGVLVVAAGGAVGREHGEGPSAPWIATTVAGDEDPLFADVPELFRAFTGHKEAVTRVPDGAVVLAANAACPVQAIRLGSNVHAVQFHPELTGRALAQRLVVYQDFGYFPPHEVDGLVRWANGTDVGDAAASIVRAFVRRHARDWVAPGDTGPGRGT